MYNTDISDTQAVSMSGDGSIICGSDTTLCQFVVYYYNGSNWVLYDQILYGSSTSDLFGSSADISRDGTTLIIGASSAKICDDIQVK